jgi:four helix bundle protein
MLAMQRITSHKDLIVWQKAVRLARSVYERTHSFPRQHRYGLSNQMQRSALSVASNIAEGAARLSRPEYIRFLNIARSSLSELETQTYISIELGLISGQASIVEDIAEIGRMLTSLIQRLREQRSRDAPCWAR